MIFTCYICKTGFDKKYNLERHLQKFRCKADCLLDLNKLNDMCKELLYLKNTNNIQKSNLETLENIDISEIEKSKKDTKDIKDIKDIKDTKDTKDIKVIGNNNKIINEQNNITNNVTNNIIIKIEINPINKLNTKYLDSEKLKQMIYKYDDMTPKTPEKINLILSDYIKNVICNDAHPENHAIKYTRIRPPTYKCLIEDTDGNSISIARNLKDTCELLTDPILSSLKKKIRQFLLKYQKDDKEDFDYGLYDTAIDQLKKEMNNVTVKKALSSVLQNDILSNMKFKVYRK